MNELTPEEQAAIDSIDMTPILGTLSERLQFAMDKAVEYMRRARLAEKQVKMLQALCKQQAKDLEEAHDAIQSVLTDPNAKCSEYSKVKLTLAKGAPIPGYRYRVYSSENWDAVETALLAINNLTQETE